MSTSIRAWRGLAKVALRSIRRNRMRSLLTSLGIVIGVSAVIVMVAVGQGAQSNIENELASLGTNLIIVFPGTSSKGGVSRGAGSENRLTLDDNKKLEEEAALINGVSPVVRSGAQVIGGGNNWNTTVYGVDPEYFAIRDWTVATGQAFTDRDVLSRGKVAVLGSRVAKELFNGQDPIGETVRIENTPFEVIGILAEKGQTAFGTDQDDVILAPSTTVLYRLKGGQYIDMINASAVSAELMDKAQEEMRILLRESQRLRPGEEDNFTIRNQVEITQAFSQTSQTLTLLLGSIAAVSLIVGGIGIMNIMLVSVAERTREIGIRLSVGARSRDILAQFLAESVVLSLTGGLLGILASFGIVLSINIFTSLTALIKSEIVLLSFSFAGMIGVFFGFYPARKAALLNPIEAIRYE